MKILTTVAFALGLSCSVHEEATAVAAESAAGNVIVITESTPGYPGAVVGAVAREIVIDESTPGYPGPIVLSPRPIVAMHSAAVRRSGQ